MQQGAKPTGEQIERFLDALRQTANVSLSAKAAGVSRQTAYHWRDLDSGFAERWVEAIDVATDGLEAEARRRAMEGVEEYLTGRDGLIKDDDGNPVIQRRCSDSLLMFLLRAHRPEKYRDRSSVDLNIQGDLAAAIEEGRRRVREGRG